MFNLPFSKAAGTTNTINSNKMYIYLQTAKQLKLQVFATSVPLSDNTVCAAFTSTPECAHQKCNITFADAPEISASEHEIGYM
jgi:hypothetical protein